MNESARRPPPRLRRSAGQSPKKVCSPDNWAAAVRHLRRVDPHLRAIIDRVGPCRLEPHPDRFGALVRSIISQQISSKAAASINQRLVEMGGDLKIRHGLAEVPKPRDCHALAEAWRPYRTVASCYIWKGTDTQFVKQPTPPDEVGRPRIRSKPGQSR